MKAPSFINLFIHKNWVPPAHLGLVQGLGTHREPGTSFPDGACHVVEVATNKELCIWGVLLWLGWPGKASLRRPCTEVGMDSGHEPGRDFGNKCSRQRDRQEQRPWNGTKNPRGLGTVPGLGSGSGLDRRSWASPVSWLPHCSSAEHNPEGPWATDSLSRSGGGV